MVLGPDFGLGWSGQRVWAVQSVGLSWVPEALQGVGSSSR
jgi:hypothetical protein